ncbi:MAG: YceI family protein [Chitinophagaceae bacterium]|nr:YceI family protein [Chitinophagaceae bacterium]
MRHLFLFAIAVFVASAGFSQQYIPQDKGSQVNFIVANLGFDVDGSLKNINGKIIFDESNLASSSFDVTVETATINTGNNTRDKHLRGKDYFDVAAHPQIRIISTRIARSVTAGFYVLFANLTIKGVTKEISFPFKATQESGGIRFTGAFKIKRRDFGVGGRSTISNDVDIKLNVFSKKL